MKTGYLTNPAHASAGKQTFAKRATFFYGCKDYRFVPHEFIQALRSRNDSPLDDRNFVRDQMSRATLDGTGEETTAQFVMQKTGLRRHELIAFSASYNVDLKKRNVAGGLN